MSDFNFVGPAYEAASVTQDTQELINWYLEMDPFREGRGALALYPTPGLSLKVQLAVGEVRGLHTVTGGAYFVAVSGPNVYKVTQFYVATQIGTLLTTQGRVWIEDNGAAAYLSDGVSRYSYIFATGVFAIQADGPFLGGGVIDELDNFFIYSNPGTNQWGSTDAGAVTSNALNLGSVLGASGNLTALIVDHRQVLLMTEKYSERWVNVGTFPFAFAVIPGSSIQHGCGAPASVARLGEGIAFLAQDTRGNATVAAWGAANPNPVRLSTFAVENAIQSYAVTSDATAYTYAQAGHEFYVLSFPSADVTWVYDLSASTLAQPIWHKRAWRDPLTGVRHRHRSNCGVLFNSDIVVGDFENGRIYTLSQTDYTDNGDPIPCIRRAPHLVSDLKRVFHHDLQIQFQPGVGLQSGQGSNPQFILRWSNDGGSTFGNDHLVNIGKVGKYKNRAIKRRLGYARDRVYEVEVTDPVYRAIVSAELNAEPGAS